MDNVLLEVKKDTLWIGVDLGMNPERALIASTEGAISPEGRPEIKVDLTVFRYAGEPILRPLEAADVEALLARVLEATVARAGALDDKIRGLDLRVAALEGVG